MLKTLIGVYKSRIEKQRGFFGHAGRPGERGGSAPKGEGGKEEGTSKVKESVRSADRTLDRWDSVISQYGASSSHARDAVKDESGKKSLQFNIKAGYPEIPEKVSSYAEQKGSDEVDQVYWQHHSDKTDELISEIRDKVPETGDIGVAGRSGGWLVVNVPDRGTDLDQSIYEVNQERDITSADIKYLKESASGVEDLCDRIESIPNMISGKISELKSDLGSDKWWKKKFPEAYK